MVGTIYLGGGGSPQDELSVWTDMLKQVNRILYWPFALSGGMLDGADGWLRANLAERWPSIAVATWTELDDHEPEDLCEFDLLFVGGGNTFNLLEHVAGSGFMDPVRRFVAAGGTYYGGSAGAVLAGGNIAIADAYDRNETGLEDLAGLGLIPHYNVLPHYGPKMEVTGRMWVRRQDVPVLGIPERSGLKIEEGQAQVLGPEPVYAIHAMATKLVGLHEFLPVGGSERYLDS